jgi:hypothetical protein
MSAAAIRAPGRVDLFSDSESALDRAMNQKATCGLIRGGRWNRQESRLVALIAAAVGTSFTASGAQPYQQKTPKPQAARSTFTPVNAADNHARDTGPARTHGRFRNFPYSNIATRIKRSHMAIVAKQEEFCCGPRQGN